MKEGPFEKCGEIYIMSDFGVFYTCYKEKEAVEYSLATLFSVYPECPVYLVSDGGHDYSYLESKYPTLKTELEEEDTHK